MRSRDFKAETRKGSWICQRSLKVLVEEVQSSSPLLLQVSDFGLETPGMLATVIQRAELESSVRHRSLSSTPFFLK
jgi:hypothetical protein